MTELFLRPNETKDQFYHRCNNITYFDCSEDEMLWWLMGPRQMPLSEILPVTVAMVVVFITGLVGNVAVCVVIVVHPSMRKTTTNYYLFNLALSDLLLLLCGLPNDLLMYWNQYPYSLGIVFCKLRALVSEAASYVSVLTIVAFSLERYLAICHPLHLYAMAGMQRASRIVAALWVVSFAAAGPFSAYITIHYQEYPPGSGNLSQQSAVCAMLELPSWYLWEISAVLSFILPVFVMLYLYVGMGQRIDYVMGYYNSRYIIYGGPKQGGAGRQGYSYWRFDRSTHVHIPGSSGTFNGVNGSVHGEARQAQSRKSIIRMLAAVVVTFFLCWAPFHMQRLFFIYGTGSEHYRSINHYLFSVSGLLYYVSATINPILYNLMSHRYRIAFKETLCCCSKARRKKIRYRDPSSIRETTVNQTSDGSHLVRIRVVTHDRRNRINQNTLRRSGYVETMELCSVHQNYDKKKEILTSEKNISIGYNNDSQVMFAENERDDSKLDTELESEV